ncbi:MAG: putative outer membrane protein involved in nutrient binding [Chitinophagaceae bacterium]|nr:putative outer membrane protein involved in nutrient binding [Chitinophagaceae bacterium]
MKFKYSFIKTIIIGCGLFLVSCNKTDFLEIRPGGTTVLTVDAIKTSDDLKKLMISAYAQINSAGFMNGNPLVSADVMADDAVTTSSIFDWSQIVGHSMDLFNPRGRDTWNNTYLAINRANVASSSTIADPILATADPAVVSQLKADAAYIRGLGFFHLVRFFGLPYSDATKNIAGRGIVIRLRGTTTITESFDKLQRSTVEEVYTQIITDLKFASANLPATRTTWNNGFATRDAAKALLAKVYFFKGDMPNAVTEAKPVMQSGTYDLDADVITKYSRATTTGGTTKEVIFAIPSVSATNNLWGGLTGAYRTNNTNGAIPQFSPSASLLAAYTPAKDLRYNKFFVTKNGVVYTKKFDYAAMDAIVTGFDELLLIYAEALASSGAPADLAEAVLWLNKIEKRAYGAPVTTVAAGQAGIIDAVRKERRLELSFRGERLHELKRLKLDVRGDAWDSRKVMFQIPDDEQSGNPGIILN